MTINDIINKIIDNDNITIDIDDEAPHLIDNLPTFDTIAQRVRGYSSEVDYDEGRSIVVNTGNGRITMFFIADKLCYIETEELPIEWYFANYREVIPMYKSDIIRSLLSKD